jgi:AAA domain
MTALDANDIARERGSKGLRKVWDATTIEELKSEPSRIRLVPFKEITLGSERRYLVKGLVPTPGLCVIWGPPKSGKSFWTFDLLMHVALGWDYRGRRVCQGPVVYCCFEGQSGIKARVEAFRQQFGSELPEHVPFFLQPVTLDLVRDHAQLIEAVRATLGGTPPGAIGLDTLNRSLVGSESSDTDMSNYIRAADAIRDAFGCSVLIVHHCGHTDSRPRGHSSLTGAVDAQLSVKRDGAGNILVTVEFMKDGDAGDTIASHLKSIVVGTDQDGEPITSCLVVEAEASCAKAPKHKKRLPKSVQIALKALEKAVIGAGEVPPASNHVPSGVSTVSVSLWRKYAYQSGISSSDEDRAKQQAFGRAHEALIAEGLVGAWGDHRWLIT